MKREALTFWKSPTWRVHLWSFLAVLAMMLMENTILSLWYHALFGPLEVNWTTVFITLLGITALSHGMVKLMERLQWHMLVRQTLFLTWMVLAVYASLKLLIYPSVPLSLKDLIILPARFILTLTEEGSASFFHLIWISLLIWRSVSVARSPVTLISIQASFQFGLIFLLLYGMAFAPLYPVQATLGLYIYLFCGLIAMSAARVFSLSELRGGRIPRFGMRWLVSIWTTAIAVVGLALLAGWLISGRVAEILASAVLILFALLTAIVLFLLSPLLVLLARLVPYLAAFIDQLLARLRNLPIMGQLQKMVEGLNQGLAKVIPFLIAGRGIILVGIILILLVVILLALRLRKIQQELVEEAESSSTDNEEEQNMLRKMVRRLLQDMRGRRLHSPAQIIAAARVRQIYRHLMSLSQKLGAPRQPSVTPLEFLPRLKDVFQNEEAGLGLITDAYLKVRYGQYPETRQEIEAVETAWARVRRKGRKVSKT